LILGFPNLKIPKFNWIKQGEKMKRFLLLFVGLLVLSATSAQNASAEVYSCPSPTLVKCIPTVNTIGTWTHNGGQMTGNTFAPNNQCANVITLPNQDSRLFCCYTKCGVFFMDVPYKCRKLSQVRFACE
jgi:hypothetical protein